MLGQYLFVSMNGNFNDKNYLKKKMDELVEQLALQGITPGSKPPRRREGGPVEEPTANPRKGEDLNIDRMFRVHAVSAELATRGFGEFRD